MPQEGAAREERGKARRGCERGRVQFLRTRLARSPPATLSSFPRVRSRRQPREAYSRWRPFRLLPSPSTARATSSVASPRSSPSRSSTARRSSSSAASSSTLPAPSSATRSAAILIWGQSSYSPTRLAPAVTTRARDEAAARARLPAGELGANRPLRRHRTETLAYQRSLGMMYTGLWVETGYYGGRGGLRVVGGRQRRGVSGHLTSGPPAAVTRSLALLLPPGGTGEGLSGY